MPELYVPDRAAPEHREAIIRLLDGYNDVASGLPEPVAPLAILLRNPGSEDILGGLWGVSYWRWLFVEQVIVPQSQRGQGLGSALLARAESEALERHCIGVWLLSFSFQAPDFYRRLGYTEFGAVEEYPPGARCVYFCKRIA